jgi:hypothetical protein
MAILFNSTTSPILDGYPDESYTLSSNLSGILAYNWEIISQPPGIPADTLSSSSSATPLLTSSKEGSYLIRLNATTSAGIVQETGLLVNPSISSGLRVPAYAEMLEAGSTGWDQGAGNMLRSVDRAREQPGVMACIATTSIAPGDLVTIAYDPTDPLGGTGSELTLTGLAGERSFPLAFDGIDPRAPLVGISLGTPNGATATAGKIVLVRFSGLYQGLAISYAGGYGDYPYLFPSGGSNLTDEYPDVEANCRCVGKVVRWSSGTPGSGTVDVMVYGDRVPRIKTVEFGSNATTDLSNASESWLPMGTNTPSIGTYHGQFVPDLGANAATILATVKVWAATPYAVVTTLKVKNARTLATFGSSFTLGSSAQETSAGFWAPFDITDPVGFTGQIASGATSPKAIAATLTFWEL